jgi:hypothetical protein
MTAHRFVYLCRLCGEMFGSTVGDHKICEGVLIQLTIDPGEPAAPPMGIAVTMTDLHQCEDGALGIGDLQGAVVHHDSEPTSKGDTE